MILERSLLELGGDAPLTPRRLAAAARSGEVVRLHPAAWEQVETGHAAVLRAAAGGTPVYGVSTGLGAVADTAVGIHDPGREKRVVLARAAGVGEEATASEVRAMMIARLAGFARGGSGASVGTVRAYAAMLNAGVRPVVPLGGSIGQGDLLPLAQVAAVLVGEGAARVGDAVVPGGEALRRAGLEPAVLAPKDGLALVSSNAAAVGLGALALADARDGLAATVAAAALALEAQGADPSPLRDEVVALRPVPGQAEVAREIRRLLEESAVAAAGRGRRLHDPLSFRCVGPVLGGVLAAIGAADAAVALELRGIGDNPAVLAGGDCTVAGTAGFDSTHLLLAFEGLKQAMARAAALNGARITALMSTAVTGLPRFLSPRAAEGHSGMAPLGKTVAALVAEIGQRATAVPVVTLPVADGIEDYAAPALPAVRDAVAIADRLGMLAAVELVVAAQAVELRGGVRTGTRLADCWSAVRAVVPALDEDRELGAEVRRLHAAMVGVRNGWLEEVAEGLFPAG